MDWGTALGAVAAVISALAAGVAGVAKVQSDKGQIEANRETSQLDMTLAAMQGHITTLSAENKTQREEMVLLRGEVKAAREETIRCEADKENLKQLVLGLQRDVRRQDGNL
jgi:dihydroorotase-like cyclic amidohydrolase